MTEPAAGKAGAAERQGVVLPEPKMFDPNDYVTEAYQDGWNQCLDEVTRLNPFVRRPQTEGELLTVTLPKRTEVQHHD